MKFYNKQIGRTYKLVRQVGQERQVGQALQVGRSCRKGVKVRQVGQVGRSDGYLRKAINLGRSGLTHLKLMALRKMVLSKSQKKDETKQPNRLGSICQCLNCFNFTIICGLESQMNGGFQSRTDFPSNLFSMSFKISLALSDLFPIS